MSVLALGLAAGAYAVGAYAAGSTEQVATVTYPTDPCATTTTSSKTYTTIRKVPVTTTITTPVTTTITIPVTTTVTAPVTTTDPTTTSTTPTYTTTTATTYSTTTATTSTTRTTTRTVTKRVPLVQQIWSIPRKARDISREPGKTVVAETGVVGDVRSAPNDHARVITKLRFYTPDSEALQTYLVIARERIHHQTWSLIALPMRPNGTVGWVPRSYLGAYLTTNTEIVVNRAERKLTLCRGGKIALTAPVGVGRVAMPTPAGYFWVTESFSSSDAFYGPWALGTSDLASEAAVAAGFPDGGLVGIHGTSEPWLVPGDPSHGCVRLHNPDIVKLKAMAQIGTALWVQ